MRQLVLEGGFGLHHLKVQTRVLPKPKEGEVLVRIRAASLNHRDLLMVRGEYNKNLALPLVPGSDAVGSIVECGPEVTRFAPGERVCPVFASGWHFGRPSRRAASQARGGTKEGVLQEYLVVPEEDLVRPPAFLSDEQAATLPCAALTAFSAFFRHGSLAPGEWVVVIGTGGVSLFALQFAKAHGAKVIVTSRSAEKLERAKAMGANHVIATARGAKFGREVRELTGGEGADHVIDVGGAETLAESLAAVRPGGQVNLIGVLGGTSSNGTGEGLDLLPILMRDVRVQGVFVGPKRSFEVMNAFIEEHQLVPVVDRVFELDDAAEALAYLESGRHFGKVCVRV